MDFILGVYIMSSVVSIARLPEQRVSEGTTLRILRSGLRTLGYALVAGVLVPLGPLFLLCWACKYLEEGRGPRMESSVG